MLTLDDLLRWRESFATCAIEGNKFAIHMMELWENDRQKYKEELEKFIKEE